MYLIIQVTISCIAKVPLTGSEDITCRVGGSRSKRDRLTNRV